MEHILIIRGGKKGEEEKDIALHSIPFDLIRFVVRCTRFRCILYECNCMT